MIKCKCIKDLAISEDLKFSNNCFYYYEFVPSMGSRGAIYRIFLESGKFHNFTFSEFREFFKNFQL
ncbi:MAG: hypothetical protein JXB00_19140 [Bacteroidales bacterium]|nr:hypothetical protein [Bacteroidales bacterium]